MESKIDRYINKVISDACLAEGKENDVQYQFRIVEDVVVFAIDTKFERVKRRVEYRLRNNIPKNFGLKFNEDFDIYIGGFDLNYSIMRWDVFGQFSTLRAFGDKEHLQPKHGENETLDFFIDRKYDQDESGWNSYLSDFEKVYGKRLAESK